MSLGLSRKVLGFLVSSPHGRDELLDFVGVFDAFGHFDA
jgi:hypothetical protein